MMVRVVFAQEELHRLGRSAVISSRRDQIHATHRKRFERREGVEGRGMQGRGAKWARHGKPACRFVRSGKSEAVLQLGVRGRVEERHR